MENNLWFRVLIIIILFLVACFAAGQAITFAWISSFPEQTSRLESLEIKFWTYTIASIVLFVVDLILVIKGIRRANWKSRS